MKKKVVIITLLCAAGLGGWYFRHPKSAPSKGESEAVATQFMAVAEKRNVEFTIEVSGDVTPDFQLDVRPEVGGKVKKIYVKPGQTVKTGEALIEIDDTDLLTQRK